MRKVDENKGKMMEERIGGKGKKERRENQQRKKEGRGRGDDRVKVREDMKKGEKEGTRERWKR